MLLCQQYPRRLIELLTPTPVYGPHAMYKNSSQRGRVAAGRSSSSTWTFGVLFLSVCTALYPDGAAGAEPPRLIAHWPLASDAREAVGGMHGTAKNVEFGEKEAIFNGRDSLVEIPDDDRLD